ncbi:MAG: ABC transporter permease [Phycisphaerales bacterium]
MILTQTYAIFLDAYRELNAKKLFWLTLALNLLVVVLFAALSINSKGVNFFHWTFNNNFLNSDSISPELFYKIQFTEWGVPLWLSWVAIILALISTAGIIPDLVSGGTIEPVLSKPIGRLRLFLTKYLTGLLFVALQVMVFSVGCILVMGFRAGAWEFKLLLAVPIVLAMFSYLYAFCAFVGLITRSTIAALLLTIIFWFALWLVNTTDSMMIAQREGSILEIEDQQKIVESQISFSNKRIAQLREQDKPVPGEGDEPLPDGYADQLEAVNPALSQSRSNLIDAQESAETWKAWAGRIITAKTILPKTQETIALLSRTLIDREELAILMGMSERQAERMAAEQNDDNAPAFADPRVGQRVEEIMRARTTTWILGTSFAFQFFLLALSSIIFIRRDF